MDDLSFYIAIILCAIVFGIYGRKNKKKSERPIGRDGLIDTGNKAGAGNQRDNDCQQSPSETDNGANADSDSNDMEDLYHKAMYYGPNKDDLENAQEKLINILVLRKDGTCKGGGFTGVMDEGDRAKKIARIDENLVMPALGNNPVMYEAWWSVAYQKAFESMQNSPYQQQISVLDSIIEDVQLGDEFLADSGVAAFMANPRPGNVEIIKKCAILTLPNGEPCYDTSVIIKSEDSGRKIKVRTEGDTVKIKRETHKGRTYYEIKNVYKYFQYGLSDDNLVRLAEMLIAPASILQIKKKTVNKVWMEDYALPSLTKLSKES